MTGRRLAQEPMARIRAARRRPDEGVSMILALALVLGIGVIVGALLTYAGTSLTTMASGSDAQLTYDVDGALQTAVDTIRTSTYNQDETMPDIGCLRAAPPADVLSVDGEHTDVTVRCTPKPETGAASGKVPINENNRFADAIHVADGLHQTARASVLIRGDVRSRDEIDVVGGPACPEDGGYPGGGTACGGLWADGEVQAASDCSGTVVSLAGERDCHANVSEVDPQASPAPTSATPYREVPKCAATVELQPGIYDDAAALSKLTNGGCGATATTPPEPKVTKLVVKPGTYFFDFRNEEATADPSLPFQPGDNTWTIDKSGLTVIGGDESGLDFGAFACVSPMKSTAAWGVRLVFGGNSRMVVKKGDVSLCGTYSATDQPIVVQGSTVDHEVDSSSTAKPNGGTTGASAGGGFSPSGGAALAQAVSEAEEPPATPDTAVVNFTRQPGGPQTLWAEFTGYLRAPDSIPKGSILTGATLNLKHRETDAGAGDTVKITVDAGPGLQLQPNTQPSTRQDLTLDSLDLLSAPLIERAHAQGLRDLKLRYELTAAPGSGDIQAEIDLATLTFTWTQPVVRKQAADTEVLVTSPGARFRVDGAIYTPRAAVKLGLANVDYLVVSGGMVAREVELAIEPKDGFTRPVIQTPAISLGPKPLEVYLVAYTCRGGQCGSPPPSSGWKAVGTAAILFKDDLDPGPPKRTVDVRSWQLSP